MINIRMKTFKQYLAENKKVYSFKIKVAGDLPENFITDFKSRMTKCEVVTLDESLVTPVQNLPIDFPNLKNTDVHIIEFVAKYPITSPEITKELMDMGLSENSFRVRGSGEPSEIDQLILDQLVGNTIKNDIAVTEIQHKDYFGDEFNKGFLKELAKTAKEQKKEGAGLTEYELPKPKKEKVGTASAIGSK